MKVTSINVSWSKPKPLSISSKTPLKIQCRSALRSCRLKSWRSWASYCLDITRMECLDIISSSKRTPSSICSTLNLPSICWFATLERNLRKISKSIRSWSPWVSKKWSSGSMKKCSMASIFSLSLPSTTSQLKRLQSPFLPFPPSKIYPQRLRSRQPHSRRQSHTRPPDIQLNLSSPSNRPSPLRKKQWNRRLVEENEKW